MMQIGSFTKEAEQLGVSQFALSYITCAHDERAGLRLPTTIGPRLDEMEEEVAALSDFQDKPAENIRTTATGYLARTVLWPKLARFLLDYPHIKTEFLNGYGFVDLAVERFDAGVHLGDQIVTNKPLLWIEVFPTTYE
jgi:DNA-binding transcriptional LysR family regulator